MPGSSTGRAPGFEPGGHGFEPRPGRQLSLEEGRQLLKIAAVILRDHSPITPMEAVFAFTYCWTRTESIEAAENRELREQIQGLDVPGP